MRVAAQCVDADIVKWGANLLHKATRGCEVVVGVISGVCLSDEEPMLALECCNSGSMLFDQCEKPPVPDLVRLLGQALARIANLLLHRDADTGVLVVKATDFGSARKDKAAPSRADAFFTMASMSMAPSAATTGGTRVYMPSRAVRR